MRCSCHFCSNRPNQSVCLRSNSTCASTRGFPHPNKHREKYNAQRQHCCCGTSTNQISLERPTKQCHPRTKRQQGMQRTPNLLDWWMNRRGIQIHCNRMVFYILHLGKNFLRSRCCCTQPDTLCKRNLVMCFDLERYRLGTLDRWCHFWH